MERKERELSSAVVFGPTRKEPQVPLVNTQLTKPTSPVESAVNSVGQNTGKDSLTSKEKGSPMLCSGYTWALLVMSHSI